MRSKSSNQKPRGTLTITVEDHKPKTEAPCICGAPLFSAGDWERSRGQADFIYVECSYCWRLLGAWTKTGIVEDLTSPELAELNRRLRANEG